MTKWHLGEVGETERGRGECWGGEAGVGEVHTGQGGQVLQGGGVSRRKTGRRSRRKEQEE